MNKNHLFLVAIMITDGLQAQPTKKLTKAATSTSTKTSTVAASQNSYILFQHSPGEKHGIVINQLHKTHYHE